MKTKTLLAAAALSTLVAACSPAKRHALLTTHVLERMSLADQELLLGPPGSNEGRSRVLIAPTDLALGPKDAPVVLVGFVDISDETGGLAIRAMRTVQEAHAKNVRVVLKPMTRPDAAISRHVAEAVAAANAQGLGWELAECVAAPDVPATAEGLDSCVAKLRIDPARLAHDLVVAGAHVNEITAVMSRLAVTGSPTMFLNGYRIKGLPPTEILDGGVVAAIDEAENIVQASNLARAAVYPEIMRGASVPTSKVTPYVDSDDSVN